MQHLPRNPPPRCAALAPAPKPALGRWFAFGLLCGMVAAACFIERFPLLAG